MRRVDKIMTPEEIGKIISTERETEAQYKHHVHVCVAAGCLSSRSDQVKSALEEEVKQQGREHECHVKGVGCMGLCAAGPLVSVQTDGTLYQEVRPEDAAEIVQSLDREPVARLKGPSDSSFFTRQVKIVLENCGIIDPDRVEDYLAAGGYQAMTKSLTEMTPSEVIEEVYKSGLRGRGGAGYPTGLKWSTVSKARGTQKYVICNADEGDPGAFMDRSVLESDPHRGPGRDGHRRLRGRRKPGLRVRARRISPRHPAPAERHQTGAEAAFPRNRYLWNDLQLQH